MNELVTGPAVQSFTIRRFQDQDAPAIAALRQQVTDEGKFLCGGIVDCSAVAEGLVLSNLVSQGGLALCAENADAQVVGHLALQRGLGASAHTAEVSLFVAAPWRHRGIGRALLQEAIAWAPAAGVRKICLEVFSDNCLAIDLYRGLGFVEEGVRRRQIQRQDGDQDVVLMGLFLDQKHD